MRLRNFALAILLAALLLVTASPATAAVLDGRVSSLAAGESWTSRTTPVDKPSSSVTYGKGLFVAFSCTGSGNRVMTSPDGITWNSRLSPVNNN